MNQLTRTLQTIVDFSENTEIFDNSNAAQQQDAANSITSTTDNQNDDPLPIVCLDDAVGIVHWQIKK